MYLILHAFSRRNSGDGLLVDLTLEALEDAGIARKDCVLFALDPESFADDELRVMRAPGEPFAKLTPQLAMSGIEVLVRTASAGRWGKAARAVRDAKALIAVGGGYLVADEPKRKLGVLLNHMAQMSAAAKSDIPSIYLPQSIGPLEGRVGQMAKHHLQKLDRLYVRDDLTLSEVGSANTRRVPDLAVMKLARSLTDIAPVAPTGKTILVARDLPRPNDYTARLGQLHSLVSDPAWLVQADAKGPRSDRAFYERLGHKDSGMMEDLMKTDMGGIVISVRLHGAIAALLAGRPAIHLAYERKGWGAYEDLGISNYVHDARSFDPQTVAEQATALQQDPQQFWDKIAVAAPKIIAQYDEMIEDMKTLMHGT